MTSKVPHAVPAHSEFDERRRSLEEQFFQRQNEALVRKLREAASRNATRDEIRELTGISQQHLLDALADMKVGAAATLVMSVFPLIEVGWADGNVSDKERRVVLEQAASIGIAPGTEASLFLAHWLDERPDERWRQLWLEYVRELCRLMPEEDRALLKSELLGRARHVAEASGGIFGRGWSVSAPEREALERLARAFDVDSPSGPVAPGGS